MYWIPVSTQSGQFDNLSEDSTIVRDNKQHFVVQLEATFFHQNFDLKKREEIKIIFMMQ